MNDNNGTVVHLRPMHPSTVNVICDAVHRLCRDSYVVLMEANGFRQSRTPWDARRLANALAAYNRSDAVPEIAEIVGELDLLALEKAGLKPGPRSHLGGKR